MMAHCKKTRMPPGAVSSLSVIFAFLLDSEGWISSLIVLQSRPLQGTAQTTSSININQCQGICYQQQALMPEA